jgi:arylsulfatase A-like enzyme/Flp pilus assembly protein TadD
MKRIALLAGMALLGAVVFGYWSWRSSREHRSVLLVTIDTLRADAIASIGGGSHTPVLDQLIEGGVLFADAASAAPTTGPSHTSILSGQFPYRHGYRNNGQSVADHTPWLPEILHRDGYRTAAFVSGFPLNRMFGFGRGFETYDDDFGPAPDNRFKLSERSAKATTQAALAWLPGVAGKPWFAWVHYYDPHAPYSAPEAFAQAGPRGEYLAEVAYVDHWLGELVAAARKQDPEVVVIITSDHGEGLGDHSESDHGLLLYQSTIRVPLIVNAPSLFAPRRDARVARTVDVTPTVLSLAGASATGAMDGIDLGPLMNGAAGAIPPAYSETYFGSMTYGFAPLRALRIADSKRIEGTNSRYFDLAADPAESHPLAEAAAGAAGARLESLLASIPDLPVGSDRSAAPTDAQAMARLRSLGYLGAGTATDSKRWDAALDPEEHLAEHNEILRAQQSFERGDLIMAEARFRAILQLSPENRVAWLRLGSIYFARRNLAAAIEALGTAVSLDPLNPEAHYQLAEALTRSKQYPQAIVEWKSVTALQPARSVAWSNLGTSQWMSGDRKGAVASLLEATGLDPASVELRENLARAQLQTGGGPGAVSSLLELARLQSEQFVLDAVLAEQLARANRIEEAEQWLSRSRSDHEGYSNAHLALAIAEVASDRARALAHIREVVRVDPRKRRAIEADPELASLLE